MVTTMRNMQERGKSVDTLPGPEPTRFAWSPPSAKQKTDYGEWADYVGTRIPLDTQIFLDTCFVTSHEIPVALWNALLSRKLVLTPTVWDELGPWFNNPRCNRVFKQQIDRARSEVWPRIRWANYDYAEKERSLRWAIPYYIQLLATRKLEAGWLVEHFRKQNGREPTKQERDRLFQRKGDERGFWLRKKGYETEGGPNFVADEELVTFAVLDSLAKGSDCIIFTRDADVLDQFYKLTVLIDTHYRDMWFADFYSRNKQYMKTCTMPDTRYTDEFFDAKASLLVEKPDGIPDKLFPPAQRQILLCILFGGEGQSLVFTPIFYVADKDMWRISIPRTMTKGRCCTHLLDGMNCYSRSTPVGIDYNRYAMITTDKVFEASWMSLTRFDVSAAIYYTERPVFRPSARSHFILDSRLLELEERLQAELGPLVERACLRLSISHTLLPYQGLGTRSRKPN